jgi:phosphoserine phosphatase
VERRNVTFLRHVSRTLVAAGLSAAAAGCAPTDSTRSPADDAQVDGAAVNADPLPSWNEGAAKRAIVEFVERVTEPGGPDYVAPEDRVATFDNDGTLWAEKPTYFQVVFLSDRVGELAAEHPEWRSTQPFKAVLEGDADYLHAIGVGEVFELFTATHAGMSQTEFEAEAREFLETARHPRFDVPFPELIYQPMLELLDHLRANEFKVFIVSGGGIEFIRQFSEAAYGIPREDVIGSSLKYEFRETDPGSEIYRLPELGSFDDKEVKPANIQLHIGRRPILAVGNSDGDIQMMQYATDGSGPRLSLLLHHDDAEREYDYDHGTERALEMAANRGWTVVSVRDDFRRVFPFEE